MTHNLPRFYIIISVVRADNFIAISRGFSSFSPKISSLEILDTTKTTFTLQAKVNFTNPTEYSAVVPYVDLKIINNGTVLGHATAKDVSVGPGDNDNIPIVAVWDPLTPGGKKGRDLGREFLSQYISGMFHVIRSVFAEGNCILTGVKAEIRH